MAVYAYIDVSQKQEYIYKKSKLVDNLYHSFIIKSVTEQLNRREEPAEKESLTKLKEILSLEKYLDRNFYKKYTFEYSGGGNSIIRFERLEDGISFVQGYSFEVLKAYPDLELYISLVDEEKDKIVYQCDKDRQIRELLIKKSDELKDKRKSRFKRWTYGIETIGESGRAKKPDNPRDNTEEARKKIIRKHLFEKFANALEPSVTLISELDKYKKDEGKSYIGVISIDGNKMGDMVKKIDHFEDLRNFSETIDNIYFDAIVEALQEYREKAKIQSLLLTPILQAGDDICLIVEAEHAITIAAEIIRKIETVSKRDDNQKVLQKVIGSSYLTACGGVAIAGYSYPFFEAVKIAEGLCHRAKENVYLVKAAKEERRNSYLHWEVVKSQVAAKTEYECYVKNRNIQEKYHIKPLCLDQTDLVEDNIFSYYAFSSLIRGIQEENISSSLLEQLKKHMYGGIESYRLFLEINKKDGKILEDLVMKILDKHVDQYMTMVEENEKEITYTYVLNDVLEALPFMAKLGGNSDGTGKELSN